MVPLLHRNTLLDLLNCGAKVNRTAPKGRPNFYGNGNMAEETPAKTLMSADIARIMKLLPHRYPFLLIDKMIDMDGEESGTAIKNVTINEPFFQGHFPGQARDARGVAD